MSDTMTGRVWLLQNMLNPFPIAADLTAEGGRARLTLDPIAADAVTGWLEKVLEMPDLKDRVRAGEKVTVFDVAGADASVSSPKTLMGAGVKLDASGREWLLSVVYPSAGAYSSVKALMHRKEGKKWRQALVSNGVKEG